MTQADLYAVIGHPVAHSRSPSIHARFAAQTGLAVRYERMEAPVDGFEAVLRSFIAAGGRGCNVTVPFKHEAHALALREGARVTPRAALAGAVNTLTFEVTWAADNTDGAGLVRDLEDNAGVPLARLRVLLIGAGGAAAGVLGPLLERRPATLVVANRSRDKAQALVARHAPWAQAHGVALSGRGLEDPGVKFDVVINGTAASMSGAGVPVPARVLARGGLALDMMYGPAARGFLDWAAAAGGRGRDGLGMLVEQAAESFALWRGVRPDTASVLQALREEVGG